MSPTHTLVFREVMVDRLPWKLPDYPHNQYSNILLVITVSIVYRLTLCGSMIPYVVQNTVIWYAYETGNNLYFVIPVVQVNSDGHPILHHPQSPLKTTSYSRTNVCLKKVIKTKQKL